VLTTIKKFIKRSSKHITGRTFWN